MNLAFKIEDKDRDFVLIIIFILFCIFTVSFAFINILKFKIFSSTCFGWAQQYTYPKIAAGKSISSLYIFPEYPVLYFILTPINYLLVFVYKIMPRPETLLILETIIVASGCFPVYMLARNILGNKYLAFAFAASYLLHPVVTTGAMLGYIPIVTGLPALLFTFYYLEKKDFRKFIFFAILANISKIDAVIMNFIFGIILLFDKDKKKFAKALIKVSFFWLLIIISFTLIYLNAIKKPFPAVLLHFDEYGDRLTDTLRYVLNNPFLVLGNIFRSGNMLFYLFLFPANFFCFFSPSYLLPVVFEIGYILVRNQHSSGHFLILAFVFAASIYGVNKIINFMDKVFYKDETKGLRNNLFANILATLILALGLMQHYYLKPKCDFYANLGPMPFTKSFNFKFYQPTKHTEVGYRLLKMIRPEGSCLTSPSLASHLNRCRFLALFNKYTIRKEYDWDYVFVDLSKDEFYQIESNDFFLKLRQLLIKGNYGVVEFEDGWLLLEKNYKQDKNIKVLTYIKEVLSDEKSI